MTAPDVQKSAYRLAFSLETETKQFIVSGLRQF